MATELKVSPNANEQHAKQTLGLGFDKFKQDKRMAESYLGRTGEQMINKSKIANSQGGYGNHASRRKTGEEDQ